MFSGLESLESVRSISVKRLFAVGVVGGVVATAIQYLGSLLLGLPFPPEEIFRFILSPVPGSIQSVAVENFGEYAKYSAYAFAAIAYMLFYGLLGAVVGVGIRKHLSTRLAIVPLILLPLASGLTFEFMLAASYSSLATSLGWVMVTLLLIFATITYSAIFLKLAARSRQNLLITQPVRSPTRRGLLKKAVGVSVGVVVVAVGLKLGLSFLSGHPLVESNNPIPVNPEITSTTASTGTLASTTLESATETTSLTETSTTTKALQSIFMDPAISDLLRSEVTDARIFYRVDIDPDPPELDFDSWSLKVHGKVANPLTLNKADLLSMSKTSEYVTFECISNTINPSAGLIGNAKWTGVPITLILSRAGLQPDAKYVVFHSAEGYVVGVPLDRAWHPESILAYMMNDQPLRADHGFPVRAVIPGLYGMMSAKWITEIEIISDVYLGFWQTRGWSNDAQIKTTSIIYYPSVLAGADFGVVRLGATSGIIPIAGVAFAGERGISKVEVSTDGGNTWNQAFIKQPLSPFSWVLWAYSWTPAPGQYVLKVRATDGTGNLQDSTTTNPFPNGATGYNQVKVTVAF